MAITFRVDDVASVGSPLPTRPMNAALLQTLGIDALHHVSHEANLIAEGKGFHPLLEAVHRAFAEHRPLSISPDHLWLTLAQGFAFHVDHNAEALRERFVRHDGKALLNIDVLSLPTSSEAWGNVVHAFGDRIAEHVGPGIHRLLACSFSTSTDVEHVAAGIVMMSTFKRYFDYSLTCICGIPEITLEGTTADWLDIRKRVDVLAEYDLEWWAVALRPLLDELVRTSEGKPDRDFWQCIYKPKEIYGGELATGWIMRLFPYLASEARNPAVLQPGKVEQEEEDEDGGFPQRRRQSTPGHDPERNKARDRDPLRMRWCGPGISPTSVPMAWSNARLKIVGTDQSYTTVTLFGGFAGVKQLEDDDAQQKKRALRPEIAWVIGPTPRMTQIIERIVQEPSKHTIAKSVPVKKGNEEGEENPFDRAMMFGLTAELIELYASMESGVLLFGRWRIPARKDLREIVGQPLTGFKGLIPGLEEPRGYSPSTELPVLPICMLEGDNRYFSLYENMIILCDPRVEQDVEHIPVVATTTALFFERIFEHEGALSWLEDESVTATFEMLYPHLTFHDHLRRALMEPSEGEPVPTDLSEREKNQLVMEICRGRAKSPAQLQHWWEALRLATGTTLTFDVVFRQEKHRYPIHILEDLGLR